MLVRPIANIRFRRHFGGVLVGSGGNPPPVVEGIDVLRKISAVLVAAAAGATVLLAGGGPASAAASPSVVSPADSCSGPIGIGIKIDSFAFQPAVVRPGMSANAVLAATNCTTVPRTVNETWTGRFSTLTGTGLPEGCPVIDPLVRTVNFAPNAQVTTTTGYLVPAGCTADRLTVTVTMSQNGVQLAQQSAVLTID